MPTYTRGTRLNSVPRNPIRDFLGNDLDWISGEAACRGRDALFFAHGDVNDGKAKDICATCPLLEACAQYALHHSVQGVWGGMTDEDRENYRNGRGITVRAGLEPCGTPAAHRRHLRRGEQPCAACKQADSEHRRARRERTA